MRKTSKFPRKTPIAFPKGEQIKKFANSIQELISFIADQGYSLSNSASGIEPEKVLVMEIEDNAKTLEFATAVSLIDGMVLLADSILEIASQIEIDGIDDKEKSVSKLYMILTNQKGAMTFLNLWNKYKNDKLGYGEAKFQHAFSFLKDLRFWSAKDRLEENPHLIENWLFDIKHSSQPLITFEIEFWYKDELSAREKVNLKIEEIIQKHEGNVLHRCTIDEIKYHALLVQLPKDHLKKMLDSHHEIYKVSDIEISLINADAIKYFLPCGQTNRPILLEDEIYSVENHPFSIKALNSPVAALFDSIPISNHLFLKNHVMVDDPDNFASTHEAKHRSHGTGMASLIIHGDYGTSSPIESTLYVRPVLRLNDGKEEIPANLLFLDLIFSSVQRIFVGENNEKAIAPSVKIINFSIGFPNIPFIRDVSKLAQLLDWLSWKYGVLFIVSAGNYLSEIELPKGIDFSDEKNNFEMTMFSLLQDAKNRKLLSPAESINCLTVGSSHLDNSRILNDKVFTSERFVPYSNSHFPSPYTAAGLGYKGSVKPEILIPGGRICFQSNVTSSTSLSVKNFPGLGNQAAAPSKEIGKLNQTSFTSGTSNSAALATHNGVKILEMLNSQFNIPNSKLESLFVKTLLIHGSKSGNIRNSIQCAFNKLGIGKVKNQKIHVAKFCGFGTFDMQNILHSLDHRVLILGHGEIEKNQSHIFSLPIPEILSGKKMFRKITITLCWFSPINVKDSKYRVSKLKIDTSSLEGSTDLGVESSFEVPLHLMKNTVQHIETFGKKSTVFDDDPFYKIKVTCSEEARGLQEKIPYTLAVTLEVDEGVDIYTQIRSRILVPVQVKV